MAAKRRSAKPSKGKRFAKVVKNPKTGRTRKVSYGQAGKAKSGGDRIRPGTKKGDAYACAPRVLRSARIHHVQMTCPARNGNAAVKIHAMTDQELNEQATAKVQLHLLRKLAWLGHWCGVIVRL